MIFSEGAGFQKNVVNFVSLFLGRPNWFSEHSHNTTKAVFYARNF